MTITVNGETREVQKSALSAILAELGYAGEAVATALNGAFVPAAQREVTAVHPGDRLEVVSPQQGG
jgi:sulfur carrier protein